MICANLIGTSYRKNEKDSLTDAVLPEEIKIKMETFDNENLT